MVLLAIAQRLGFVSDQEAALDDAVSAMNGGGDRADEFYRAAHQSILDIELTAARKSGLIPGSVELFEWLKSRHIRTGIVTRNCRQAVDLIGGKALLPDAILTRNEVTKVKPDPLHLTQALGELAVTPEASLMVGDHPMDMVAGRAAGMRSVGVLTGDSTEQRLIEGGADYVISSVANLVGLITDENLL